MKMTTLCNSWKQFILDEDPDLDFVGFERNDFHEILLHAGERSHCRGC